MSDPNAWKAHAAGLMRDLGALLRNPGKAREIVYGLADFAPSGRALAWDTIAAPVFAAVKRKRPGSRRECNRVAARLERVFFEDSAASAPERMRKLAEGRHDG